MGLLGLLRLLGLLGLLEGNLCFGPHVNWHLKRSIPIYIQYTYSYTFMLHRTETREREREMRETKENIYTHMQIMCVASNYFIFFIAFFGAEINIALSFIISKYP